jgi:hypothetical protein
MNLARTVAQACLPETWFGSLPGLGGNLSRRNLERGCMRAQHAISVPWSRRSESILRPRGSADPGRIRSTYEAPEWSLGPMLVPWVGE